MLQPRLSNDTNDFPGIESAISPRGYVDTARRRAIQQQCGPIDTLKDTKDVTATYRDVMGLHSQPVMILTTNCNSEGHEPRGLTLSSVTSLSLKPEPLLCFNLQVPSRTSQVLHDREVFALNMLPGTKDSVRACRFSRAPTATT